MSRIVSKLVPLIFVLSLFSSAYANAQTAQQIQQFKNLPQAQQEQLAKQLGIDISQISSSRQNSNIGLEEQSVYPRGTRFDEFGEQQIQSDQLNNVEAEENELTLYGKDLFANGPASFTSLTNLPIPTDYIVGPGDKLSIQIFGKENAEYELLVGRDGKVVIPKLGPITVAAKSFSDLAADMADKIKQKIIGVDVNIRLAELRSMRIFVMGEAFKPGSYNVSSLSTITHAIFASGGVTDIASLRNIQLKRNGQLIARLDIYDLLNKGDTSNDVSLQAGDVVFIPTVKSTVSIDGQVRRPAIYELIGNETVSDAIDLAGGLLANGYEKAISIKRFQQSRQTQLTIDKQTQDLVVKNGDQITVPEVSDYVTDSITLIGDVARPGKYQWEQSLSVHSLLSDIKGELLETADLNYLLVLRENEKTHEFDVLQADLTVQASEGDVLLKPNDKVLVFSRIETEVFGDINLDDLAHSIDELKGNEEENWQKIIDEKLFWRSVGLEKDNEVFNYIESDNLNDQPIISLTDAEKETVLKFKDSHYFSRKRMLAPVITKLREQARFGQPVKIVEIAGEVKVPGFYPLTKNASIKSLIKAAGGLTEAAYPEKSEITRTEITNEGEAKVHHIQFKPYDELNNESTNNIKLKSKDRLNIFSTPSWQEELTVQVKGEVIFPGGYTIKRGETLKELLVRVGGLTKYGDADSVIFTRETLKEQERKNLTALSEELRKQIASESLRQQSGAGGIVSYEQANKLLKDLTNKEAVGRLVINLPELMKGDSSQDIFLENGDVLYVPIRSQSVNVIGEVYVPSSHLYTANQNYEDYIKRSGGYRDLANAEKVYIIRANGSVVIPDQNQGFWFSDKSNQNLIQAGDTIVVPFDSTRVDNMTLWANATQIVYQLAVAIAAIGSL